MENHSAAPFSYTQEPEFEQAIKHPIPALWQHRKDGYVTSSGKKKLYWCSLTSPTHTKAIVISNGRIECCLKYQELFYDFYQQGYDVYSFDHQGQGQSERMVTDSDIGHIHEFDDYASDMSDVIASFDLSRYANRYLLAHSMGSTIATRYLQTHPDHPFDKVTLCAPMFGIKTEWYFKPIAMVVGQVLTAFYAKPTYAPGQQAYYSKPFENNLLSHSKVRYHWFRCLYDGSPSLQVGGPSTRWVWQGLMAAKQAIQQTRQIKIPLLLIQAGEEKIVSNSAQVKFINKLKKTNSACQFKAIEGSKHEVLFEKDEYRNQTLNAINQFFA
ncbi:alpha/beta fold hydrolase [Vibrio sp. SBT000027]|uniref:alpha/beta fold hydrolase n=1 Tax=Vibrio sp. SBT000027 TaxID=1803384 RepID=UPI000EF493D6|nr:alpha/beta fold hydrolase [Vibrio sp. SBT000027]RLQ15486.1 alpha/beta fold hydrolase [Vibrio sp. SBT000027]